MPQEAYGRYAAVRRRELRNAWLWLALSLLIPIFAFAAIHTGWTMRHREPRQGWALVALSVANLAAHVALLAIL
jgi:hypothetical protein